MAMGFYDFNLIINLETQIDLYEQDRIAHWQTFEPKFKQAERFANAVLKNSETLIPVEEIDSDLSELQEDIDKSQNPDKTYQQILKSNLPIEEQSTEVARLFSLEDPSSEESPLRLIWERFVINLSREAIRKITDGALRIFKLYNLVLSSSPSKSTQSFLSRLSRCYVWGFEPECIILCRSVVDTAFRDYIDDEICKRQGEYSTNSKGEYYFTLSNRIKAAFKEGIIDRRAKDMAFVIKERGDKAVHYQPDITTQVWETICDTVAVLEKIT